MIQKRIVELNIDDNIPDYPAVNCELIKFSKVDNEMVRKTVNKLKTKTSKIDPIPTQYIKECIDILAPFITCIINNIFESGIHPALLKQATLTPVIKKPTNNPEDLKSYRPVCQNTFISKVVDTILHNQLKEYLNDNKLESPYQAGYKTHNSCETLVNALYDQLYLGYENNKMQILFALDYSAAFDCLVQNQLLEIFNKEFKIKEKALDVMRTYFKERSYTIDINGYKSKEQPLLIGSGQGSVLSSLGFALDVNQ